MYMCGTYPRVKGESTKYTFGDFLEGNLPSEVCKCDRMKYYECFIGHMIYFDVVDVVNKRALIKSFSKERDPILDYIVFELDRLGWVSVELLDD